MNTNNDIDSLLAEASERIKREAYAAGWRDAFAQLESALAEFKESAEIKEKMAGAGSPSPMPGTRTPNGKMPKQGTTPHAILVAVMAKPGMTGGEIADAIRATGHTAPLPSISTNIQRLKQKRMIVLRHGKWYAE